MIFSKPKLWHSVYRSTYPTGFFTGCRQMHKNKHMHACRPLDLWRFQFGPPVCSPTVKSNKSLQTTSFPRLFHLKLVFDLSASHKSKYGLLIAVFVELTYCCLFAGIYQDRDKRAPQRRASAFSVCVFSIQGKPTYDSVGQDGEVVWRDVRSVLPHLVHQVTREGLQAATACLQIDAVALLCL